MKTHPGSVEGAPAHRLQLRLGLLEPVQPRLDRDHEEERAVLIAHRADVRSGQVGLRSPGSFAADVALVTLAAMSRSHADRAASGPSWRRRTMMPRVPPAPRLVVRARARHLEPPNEVKQMFVVVGEALVDLVGQRGGRTLDPHTGWQPGERRARPGAAGRPRDAQDASGDDALGAMIREHLEASGVRVDGGPEGICRRAWRSRRSRRGSPPTTSGSIGMWGRSSRSRSRRAVSTRFVGDGPDARERDVVDLMEREHERGRATVSYDPNVRPALMGDAARARPDSSVSSVCPTSSRPATRTFTGSTLTGPMRTSRRPGSPPAPPWSS